MSTILEFKKHNKQLDPLDLDLLISAAIGKPREFILAHPEHKIPSFKIENLKFKISRRMRGEPLAYILGHKEFYRLEFKVNKNTLIPRPETELLVELTLGKLKVHKVLKSKVFIIDVGTGSGNIIISLAKKIKDDGLPMTDYSFFGIDISKKALNIAKQNAKKHKVDKKIKFLHGNLLEPTIDKKILIENHCSLIIVANLPYGWNAWKNNCSMETISLKYEPPIALFTGKKGLEIYEKFLKQIKTNLVIGHRSSVICFFEIDPRQKKYFTKLIKNIFSKAKPIFHKDLAGRWRVCEVEM